MAKGGRIERCVKDEDVAIVEATVLFVTVEGSAWLETVEITEIISGLVIVGWIWLSSARAMWLAEDRKKMRGRRSAGRHL